MAANPLQPQEYSQSATFYQTIGSEYETHQAELDLKSTSVLTTDTPEPGSAEIIPAQTNTLPVTPPPTKISQAAGATATIKIPVIHTATSLPPAVKHLELTDVDATQQIQADLTDIHDLKVSFNPDGIKITGTAEVNGPLNAKIQGVLEIVGQLTLNNGKLETQVSSVKVNGVESVETERGQQARDAINHWLLKYLVRQQVQSFKLTEGKLSLDVLEFHESNIPTLRGSESADSVSTSAATVLPTTSGSESASSTSKPAVTVFATKGTPNVTPLTKGGATATIHLPVAINSSPDASVPTQVLRPTRSGTLPPGGIPITEEDATTLANTKIPILKDVTVSFSTDLVHVSGMIEVQLPLLNKVSRRLVVEGQIEVRNGIPYFNITSLAVAGVDISGTGIADQVQNALNTWLQNTLITQKIKSVIVDDGTLTIYP
ncbi:MAG: hypothetical protein ABI947_15495 [Chloroflexota bacterium]